MVVFCVVRVVHTFDFRLVINETPNNGDQWKECHAVSETHVFGKICIFSPSGRYQSAVNQNNTIEEEIKERLIAGNKAFYANQKMLKKIIIKEI